MSTELYKTVEVNNLPSYWKKKLTTAFFMFDSDKDGYITYDDVMTLGDALALTGAVSREDTNEIFTKLKLFAEMYSSSPCDLPTFIQKVYANLILKDSKVIEKYNAYEFWNVWFTALDRDHDNLITLDDYKLLWKILKLDTRFAGRQFIYLDKNSDGLVSRQEFMDGWSDYATDLEEDESDPRSINRMYGPLVNY